jgi:hypothetical protein
LLLLLLLLEGLVEMAIKGAPVSAQAELTAEHSGK